MQTPSPSPGSAETPGPILKEEHEQSSRLSIAGKA